MVHVAVAMYRDVHRRVLSQSKLGTSRHLGFVYWPFPVHDYHPIERSGNTQYVSSAVESRKIRVEYSNKQIFSNNCELTRAMRKPYLNLVVRVKIFLITLNRRVRYACVHIFTPRRDPK